MDDDISKLSDEQISKEWNSIGMIPTYLITQAERARFYAIDAEAYKRKISCNG